VEKQDFQTWTCGISRLTPYGKYDNQDARNSNPQAEFHGFTRGRIIGDILVGLEWGEDRVSVHGSYRTEYYVVWIFKYHRTILIPLLAGYLRQLHPKILRKMRVVKIV